MIKKGFFLVIIGLFLFFVATIVQAQNNESDNMPSESSGIKKAYECVEKSIDNKENDQISLQEAVFSILALGSNDKLERIISDSGENCWPSGNCNLKDTSQVLLAYERIGKNTEKLERWLLDQKISPRELSWFLEIDIPNHAPAICTVEYDDKDYSFNINEDMKISGSGGSCLSISSSGYWLGISDTCLEKIFEVSCDQDFISTLLYEKNSGGTLYISSKTNSAASLGTTKEIVNSSCFGVGTCNYEGSLWTALALQKSDNKIGSYLPYLLALSSNNERFFPSSFLYILTGSEDQFSNIIQKQKNGEFWQSSGSPYNRYYDTGLALWSLGGGSVEAESSKDYLLSIQEESGCWNNDNLRDSAFLTYVAWPKSVKGNSGGASGGIIDINSCVKSGYYCENNFDCLEAGGVVQREFECPVFGDGCCSVSVSELTCSERNGAVCSASQNCVGGGGSVPSLDGTCCLGTCKESFDENSCESSGRGICRTDSCLNDELKIEETCLFSGEVCCQETFDQVVGKKDGNKILIWLLIILILLAILGIIFKSKIRIWLHGLKNRRNKGPSKSGSSGPILPRHPPRFIPRRRSIRGGVPPRTHINRSTLKDKEMEDTLKKLREISR